jgi:serine phosphatase RsbU (regulator of sigma subunit)
VLDDFPYAAASDRLGPGEALCLITDGVTEATDARGEFYGRARLEALLAAEGAKDPEAIGAAVSADVARFAAGVEPADDVAVLIVRWNGPAG